MKNLMTAVWIIVLLLSVIVIGFWAIDDTAQKIVGQCALVGLVVSLATVAALCDED